jgi:hypothetical protein
VTFYWQVVRPPGGNLQDAIQLADPTGRVVARALQAPTGGVWPATDWQAGDVVVDRQTVLVPAGAPAGTLELSVGLADAAGQLLAVPGQSGGEVSVATLAVKARPRSAAPTAIAHLQTAAFTAPLALVGYDLAPAGVRPGDTLRLTLYWRADRPLNQSWTVFTHLLDQDEKIQAQQDGLPAAGQRPTTTWAPGEVIADAHELVVDPNARPGVDRVEIGLYDATSGQRLKLANGADRVLLDLPIPVQ